MIILIDNYDSFTYNLYQIIAAFGVHIHVVRNDHISLAGLMQLRPSGIILSPGPGRPEDAGICVPLIQALLRNNPLNIKLLGVCLGHQALVVAAAGHVIAAENIVHGKPDQIHHQQGLLYQQLPQPFTAARYHSLIADRMTFPDSLCVEATNGEGLIMGIRHREQPIFGVQFHPESILTPEGRQLLKNFIELKTTTEQPPIISSESLPSSTNYPIKKKLNPSPIKNAITKLMHHQDLTSQECRAAIETLLSTPANPLQIAAFLVLLRAKGETANEIATMVRVLREKMHPVNYCKHPLLDIVGTGGDGMDSVNLSTGSALLAASCGIKVAKHGNRSVSSLTGSADVLEALGINILLNPEHMTDCLDQIGIGFFYSPQFHPVTQSLQSLRKQLNIPTTFNLLGPLLNPTQTNYLILGVAQPALMPLIAQVLIELNIPHAFIVHGQGLDEISTAGPIDFIELNYNIQSPGRLNPSDYGFSSCSAQDLRGGDALYNAHCLLDAFRGKPGPIADSLILNAAVALYLYGKHQTIQEAIVQVRSHLLQGDALQLVQRFAHFTTSSHGEAHA